VILEARLDAIGDLLRPGLAGQLRQLPAETVVAEFSERKRNGVFDALVRFEDARENCRYCSTLLRSSRGPSFRAGRSDRRAAAPVAGLAFQQLADAGTGTPRARPVDVPALSLRPAPGGADIGRCAGNTTVSPESGAAALAAPMRASAKGERQVDERGVGGCRPPIAWRASGVRGKRSRSMPARRSGSPPCWRRGNVGRGSGGVAAQSFLQQSVEHTVAGAGQAEASSDRRIRACHASHARPHRQGPNRAAPTIGRVSPRRRVHLGVVPARRGRRQPGPTAPAARPGPGPSWRAPPAVRTAPSAVSQRFRRGPSAAVRPPTRRRAQHSPASSPRPSAGVGVGHVRPQRPLLRRVGEGQVAGLQLGQPRPPFRLALRLWRGDHGRGPIRANGSSLRRDDAFSRPGTAGFRPGRNGTSTSLPPCWPGFPGACRCAADRRR